MGSFPKVNILNSPVTSLEKAINRQKSSLCAIRIVRTFFIFYNQQMFRQALPKESIGELYFEGHYLLNLEEK